MPRPTKRTPEARHDILSAIEDGCDLYTAAAMGDMSFQCFNEWRKGDAEFNDDVEIAKGKAAKDRIDAIKNAMDADEKHWGAAAWWLERRMPRQWGKTDRLEVVTPQLRWPWEADPSEEQNGNRVSVTAQTPPSTRNGSQVSD